MAKLGALKKRLTMLTVQLKHLKSGGRERALFLFTAASINLRKILRGDWTVACALCELGKLQAKLIWPPCMDAAVRNTVFRCREPCTATCSRPNGALEQDARTRRCSQMIANGPTVLLMARCTLSMRVRERSADPEVPEAPKVRKERQRVGLPDAWKAGNPLKANRSGSCKVSKREDSFLSKNL